MSDPGMVADGHGCGGGSLAETDEVGKKGRRETNERVYKEIDGLNSGASVTASSPPKISILTVTVSYPKRKLVSLSNNSHDPLLFLL
jgi:hypothetical protein